MLVFPLPRPKSSCIGRDSSRHRSMIAITSRIFADGASSSISPTRYSSVKAAKLSLAAFLRSQLTADNAESNSASIEHAKSSCRRFTSRCVYVRSSSILCLAICHLMIDSQVKAEQFVRLGFGPSARFFEVRGGYFSQSLRFRFPLYRFLIESSSYPVVSPSRIPSRIS